MIPLNCVYEANAAEFMAALPDESIDLVVTSPPYWGLRNYGVGGQFGLEQTLEEYLLDLGLVFRHVWRVLKKSGSLYLNIGDSYSGSGCGGLREGPTPSQPPHARAKIPRKSLVGVPLHVTLKLIEGGWIWRNNIVWFKTNGMPHSVKDRFTSKHEVMPFFVKRRRGCYFDLDAVAEPCQPSTIKRLEKLLARREQFDPARHKQDLAAGHKHQNPYQILLNTAKSYERRGGLKKNPGDVWAIPTRGFRGKHFATYPEELCRRPILASCPPGGIVLDPFAGSGTTGVAALRHIAVRVTDDRVS